MITPSGLLRFWPSQCYNQTMKRKRKLFPNLILFTASLLVISYLLIMIRPTNFELPNVFWINTAKPNDIAPLGYKGPEPIACSVPAISISLQPYPEWPFIILDDNGPELKELAPVGSFSYCGRLWSNRYSPLAILIDAMAVIAAALLLTAIYAKAWNWARTTNKRSWCTVLALLSFDLIAVYLSWASSDSIGLYLFVFSLAAWAPIVINSLGWAVKRLSQINV